MKINKVILSGLDTLWKGYKKAEDEKRQISFGHMLPKVLRHTSIIFEIENLTGTELLYLKDFSSKVTILSKMINNNVSQEKSYDLHQQIEKLISLHNQIIADEDIDRTESEVLNILPIGSVSYKVFVEFTGNTIFSITGAFVNKLFIDNETGKITEFYISGKPMEDKIANLFYNNFYNYIFSKMNEVDFISEFIMTEKFYKYADNVVSLASVTTPHGKMEFFGKSNDSLAADINNIKKNLQTSPYYLYDSIKLNFVLKTSMSVFMDIYMNSNFITNHQDFKFVFDNDEKTLKVSESIINKYSTRIKEPINYISSYKKSLLDISQDPKKNPDKNFELLKYNYIFNGNTIIYCFQISIKEIEKFLNNLSEIDEFSVIKKEIEKNVELVKKVLA